MKSYRRRTYYLGAVGRRLLALVLLLLPLRVLSQMHLVGGSVGVKGLTVLDKISETSQRLGYGADFRLLYEYQYRYLLVGTGVGLSYEHSRQVLSAVETVLPGTEKIFSETGEVLPATDGLYDYMDYKVRAYNMRNSLAALSVEVPLHVGVEIKGFYMLAGGTFVLPFLNYGRQKADFQIACEYPQYPIEITIEEYGFRRFSKSVKDKMPVDLDVRGEVELGYSKTLINNDEERSMGKIRVALFGQISLLALYQTSNSTPLTKFPSDGKDIDVRLSNVYASVLSKEGMRNLTVGVRVSYMLPVGGTLPIRKATGGYYKRFRCRCAKPQRSRWR